MQTKVILESPRPGESIQIMVHVGYTFELRFDPQEGSYHRDDGNLLIRFPGEAEIVLMDFFPADNASPPTMVLPGGQELSAVEFFGGVSPVASLSPVDGGFDTGEADVVRDGGGGSLLGGLWANGLLSGLNRLDGLEHHGQAMGAPAHGGNFPHAMGSYARQEPALVAHEGTGASPADPEPQQPLPDFDDRFVIHFDQTLSGPDPYAVSGRVQTSHPAGNLHPDYGAVSENGWGTLTVNQDGTLSYTLTEPFLFRSSGPYVDYVSYLCSDGQHRRVQVVVAVNGEFDSCDPRFEHTVNGETHVGYLSGYACTVTSSDGSDQLDFVGLSAEGGRNLMVDTGLGNDTLTVQVAAVGTETVKAVASDATSAATVKFNDGDNTMRVTAEGAGSVYGVHTSTLNAGSGDDRLELRAASSGSGNAYALYGLTSDYSQVDLGDGDNYLFASASSATGGAQTVSYSDIRLGAGDDEVIIEGHGAGQTIAMGFASLELGGGNDSLYIESESTGDICIAAYESEIRHSGGAGDKADLEFYAHGNQAYAFWSSNVQTGDGDDSLRIRAEGSTAVGISSGSVSMGQGENTLNVFAKGQGAGNGISGQVTMGDANDRIRVEAEAATGNATGLSGKLDLGSGTDTAEFLVTGGNYGTGLTTAQVIHQGGGDLNFAVNVTGNGSGQSSGASSLTLTSNEGNDTITFQAQALSGSARGVTNSVITTGAGDDIVSITSVGNGQGYGLMGGTINLGTGNDSLTMHAESASNRVTAYVDSNLPPILIHEGGRGDRVDIGISAKAKTIAQAFQGVTMTLGDGDSDILLSADGATAQTVTGSTIDLGAGTDSIHVVSCATSQAFALGASSSIIHRGEAGDSATITIEATGDRSMVQGLYSSSITTADGDDVISIFADGGTGQTVALSSSTVMLGRGDDSIRVEAVGSSATAMQSSKIYLGEGDDIVTFAGGRFSSSSLVDGGSGLDTLRLEGMDVRFGSAASHLNMSGFEFLDLGDGDGLASTATFGLQDLLDMTGSLDEVSITRGGLDETAKGLFIKGDALDSVIFDGFDPGVSTGSVVHDGITYNEYALDDFGVMFVYLQNGISF